MLLSRGNILTHTFNKNFSKAAASRYKKKRHLRERKQETEGRETRVKQLRRRILSPRVSKTALRNVIRQSIRQRCARTGLNPRAYSAGMVISASSLTDSLRLTYHANLCTTSISRRSVCSFMVSSTFALMGLAASFNTRSEHSSH